MTKAKGQIFYQEPSNFSPIIKVSAVYVSVKDKILWLQQSDLKTKKETWEPPCGKIEQDETPLEAAKRELFEETSLNIPLNQFQTLGTLYIRKSIDFIYHLFSVQLTAFPLIALSNEHTLYKWASRMEAQTFPHLECGLEALDFYYSKVTTKNG